VKRANPETPCDKPKGPKPPCLIMSSVFFFFYSSGTVVNGQYHSRPAGFPYRRAVGLYHENLLSISPASICSWITFGLLPSTWQPTEKAVPRISLTVPCRVLEKDLKRMVRAISMISSSATDLLCLMFFSFLRSRGGSFRARMTREEAVGTTETAA
jgi:hypothetical protein